MTPPPAAPPDPRLHWLDCRVPPPVLVLGSALAMWGLATAWPVWRFDWPVAWRAVLAAIAVLAGLVLAGTAVAQFGRAGTTRSPMAPQDASHLVDNGVFRYTRNPMYVGLALVLLGWAFWLAHPLAMAWVLLFMAYLGQFHIKPEERALAQRFGEPYRAYCRRVPRWLL